MTPQQLLALGLITAAVCLGPACAPEAGEDAAPGPAFPEIVSNLRLVPDGARADVARRLSGDIRGRHPELAGDSVAYFWYFGEASVVSIAGDFNGWSPTTDTMEQVPMASFFWTEVRLPPGARTEYKLVVDGRWLLDPANLLRTIGGFGENSEYRMPSYRGPDGIEPRTDIPRGRVDTVVVASRVLGYPFRVYVYIPPTAASGNLPTIFVGDGGEYLSLAGMDRVLDNLIADRRIRPVIGIFLEPRTDPGDGRTSRRMAEYMLDRRFVDFLAGELRDSLRLRYPISVDPAATGIMGASLGGLLATYAGCMRPDAFGLVAAQSPAYWIMDDSIFSVVERSPRVPAAVHIDAGTLRDAQQEAQRMRDLLLARGARVQYVEVPEGHNWANWRARLPGLLVFLFGGPS